MERIRIITITFLFILSGCGKLDLDLGKAVVDFLKTEIVVGGSNFADGTSEMVVVVHLKNSNNTPVPNYKPTYNVTPVTGMTTVECSTSTSDGVSVCVLKSTSPGYKTFKLTNAKIGLEKVVEFQVQKKGQTLSLVAGANQNMTTASGHKIKLAAGEIGLGKKVVTSGGYQVSLTVKTALDSQ